MKNLGFEVSCLGKHLVLRDMHSGELHDYSFGLAGRVKITDDLHLEKIVHDQLPSGDKILITNINDVKNKLGVDWLKSSREDIEVVVRSWLSRKKQIGALLIEQKEICGIGVAWASEILHLAKISPSLSANRIGFFDLTDALIDAIVKVGRDVVKLYSSKIIKDEKKFVNKWFHNLYEIRKEYMKVYKKGTIVKVSGRDFYV